MSISKASRIGVAVQGISCHPKPSALSEVLPVLGKSYSSVFPWSPAKTNTKEKRLKLRTGKVSHRKVKKSEESPLSDEKVESGNFIGPPTLAEFAEARSLEK